MKSSCFFDNQNKSLLTQDIYAQLPAPTCKILA